jgi:serine kinase of HPr protein (carbohydrate metabolism regulator)
LLPPGWQPCAPDEVEQRFGLVSEAVGTYTYTMNGEVINRGLDLELALAVLDSQLRLNLGVKSPDAIFIHAGAVAHRGRTLIMPGRSFAGKTTLAAALVRAGAVYFSDEFAVIDMSGMIHPYAKPLSIRGGGRGQTEHSVESLGGVSGEEALPVGLVVVTSYRLGASWQPERLSPGEGAMALLENAVPARKRPAQAMKAISRALENAVVIRSDRGEADEIAPLLLAELERLAG